MYLSLSKCENFWKQRKERDGKKSERVGERRERENYENIRKKGAS